jgi:hypothetical protein
MIKELLLLLRLFRSLLLLLSSSFSSSSSVNKPPPPSRATLPRRRPASQGTAPTRASGDAPKYHPPETLDCSLTVPPARDTSRSTQDCGRARVPAKQLKEQTPPHGGCGTPTTPSSNLVRAEPGAEKPPRWYDVPTTPTWAQPTCTWAKGKGSTPSVFWLIWQHFLGAPVCMVSPGERGEREVYY